MFLLVPLLLLSLGSAAARADAESFSCPSLASLTETGACPGEEDLRYTYRGYCADNQRMYDKDQLCLDYETYRAAKNTSLWESADGRFSGYFSCDMTEARRAAARLTDVRVKTQGTLTQAICVYGKDGQLTHRTKARCRTADSCAGDPAGCTIRCE